MQTFGEDVRRAEHRRYLVERRINYGNAVSNSNMRSSLQAVVEDRGFPLRARLSSQISNYGCSTKRANISVSSPYSWQLGRSLHAIRIPVRRSLSPLPEEMPWPPAVASEPQVRWCTEPEYEKLQKEALDKAKMASYPMDGDKSNQ